MTETNTEYRFVVRLIHDTSDVCDCLAAGLWISRTVAQKQTIIFYNVNRHTHVFHQIARINRIGKLRLTPDNYLVNARLYWASAFVVPVQLVLLIGVCKDTYVVCAAVLTECQWEFDRFSANHITLWHNVVSYSQNDITSHMETGVLQTPLFYE